MKKFNDHTVVYNKEISSNMYLMGVKSEAIAKRGEPGQFIHIKIPGDNSLILRRPISINNIDRDESIVDIAYQIVGEGTRLLSLVSRGDELDILGPLGKGFAAPEEGKNIWLIGGGCGIAPLRYILSYWADTFEFTSFLGYRDIDSIYQLDEFRNASSKTFFTTEDGSAGEEGFITNILEREVGGLRPDMIMACGPLGMLRQVQAIAHVQKIPCQISLEERMGCGIGACLVCTCAIRSKDGFEYKKVCSDGPVFLSDEVILDENTQSSC